MDKTRERCRVIKAAMNGKSARAGHFSTDGRQIFSYAWPLAEVEDGHLIALPLLSEPHTQTTSEHQTVVRTALNTPAWVDVMLKDRV